MGGGMFLFLILSIHIHLKCVSLMAISLLLFIFILGLLWHLNTKRFDRVGESNLIHI